jgi:hypothetical protein
LTVSENHVDVLGIPLIVMEGCRPGTGANRLHPGANAGGTLTNLRDISGRRMGHDEKRMMAERAAETAKHARRLFPVFEHRRETLYEIRSPALM